MKILFVCIENACRSQIAEGIFNYLAEDKHKAFSAGTSTADKINPLAIKVMKEIGIDISSQNPKLIDLKIAKGMDKIISMGCVDGCPAIRIDENWQIEDPKGKGIEEFRETREIIGQKVKDLIQRLDG